MTYKLERLARVDGGADNASLQEVSLAAVAAEAGAAIAGDGGRPGVTLNIADDMPSMVVDVGRLELALVNLLSNAIKYSDPAKDRVVRRGLRSAAWTTAGAIFACATTASAFPRTKIARRSSGASPAPIPTVRSSTRSPARTRPGHCR